jgi:hypothetical protein
MELEKLQASLSRWFLVSGHLPAMEGVHAVVSTTDCTNPTNKKEDAIRRKNAVVCHIMENSIFL